MTDLKHTEGPWWFDGDEAIYFGDEPLGPEHFHTNQHIAEISFHCGIEEGEANAKLIACSPELLAMLIKIRNHEFGFSKGQVDENEINKLIKKARGEV